MKYAMLPLAALLLLATAAPGANDEPQPGRDGNYQFEAMPIEGTAWEGKFIPETNAIVYFQKGGVLRWYHSGLEFHQGSWKQTGNMIYFEAIDCYVEFRGVIQGNRIHGKADNVAKDNWAWDMKRCPVPPPGREGIQFDPRVLKR